LALRSALFVIVVELVALAFRDSAILISGGPLS
jgi:hypothetical protein